jgi:hypothetical protein
MLIANSAEKRLVELLELCNDDSLKRWLYTNKVADLLSFRSDNVKKSRSENINDCSSISLTRFQTKYGRENYNYQEISTQYRLSLIRCKKTFAILIYVCISVLSIAYLMICWEKNNCFHSLYITSDRYRTRRHHFSAITNNGHIVTLFFE